MAWCRGSSLPRPSWRAEAKQGRGEARPSPRRDGRARYRPVMMRSTSSFTVGMKPFE